MENIDNPNIKNYIQIIKGLGISFLVTFVCLLILAVALTYTNVSEDVINPTIIIITAISILMGSMLSAIKIRKNGLVNGGIIGGIYILLLYLISSVFSTNFTLTVGSIIMITVGIVFGILGGIIGVNIANK